MSASTNAAMVLLTFVVGLRSSAVTDHPLVSPCRWPDLTCRLIRGDMTFSLSRGTPTGFPTNQLVCHD